MDPLRIKLFGLLVECPFVDEVPGCPLEAHRRMSLMDRKQVAFEGMSDEAVLHVIRHHKRCLLQRS